MTKEQLDHHANQLNPNSSAFRSAQNNRANQMNPNNAAYQKGHSGRSSKK